MRIAVAGIGGTGGYMGAKFCSLQPKHEITFIARGEHAEAIKKDGLRIVEDETTYQVTPHEVCEAEEASGLFDLLLLCVKSYDIAKMIEALRKNIDENSVIIPFANGVDHTEAIRSMVDARVMHGAVYILSHIQSPGVIRKEGKVFAAIVGSKTYANETVYLEWLFTEAGLRTKTPSDILTALWKKYLFISAFATLTSYYDLSIKKVYETHTKETVSLLQEIAALAHAKGIDLIAEIDKALATAATLPEDASTSMHLDFQEHHQSELETLSGYIVHEAARHAIDVPLMQKMYTTLKER